MRRQQIEQLKAEASKRIRRMNEIESRYEATLKEREKEVLALQADAKASAELVRENMAQIRSKSQQLQIQ